MDKVTLVCPHCGFSKDIDSEKIPARVKSVGCPACSQSFSLNDAMTRVGAASVPPSDALPVGAAVSPCGTPPAVSVAAKKESSAGQRLLNFTFQGTAREYFGIWIVNTLLKIVTLGLYSPWAKVRKRRYFYGNTLLDDANFDYMANPIALLKGWLIGAALFISYSIGTRYSPVLGSFFGLVFFLLMPWIIVRSRLFNNRNSAHRNVRFNFRPAYGESYRVYAWLPFLSVFTLGFLTPYVIYRQKQFLMENNSFGRSWFGFDARVKDFYLLALKVVGLAILCFGGFMAVSSILVVGIGAPGTQAAYLFSMSTPLIMAAAYFLVFVYAYVRTTNLTWNSTFIGKNRFVSSMRARDMAWLLFSNFVASVLSVGLLVPWASVRLARYRFEKLSVLAGDDLDRFRNAQFEETSAAGEEIGDIFGVDFGF